MYLKALVFCLLLAFSCAAPALTIELDYSFDSFFGSNQVARDALEAAAADVSAAILPTLGTVGSDTFTGTNGQTTAIFEWELDVTNPTTGTTGNLINATMPEDVIRIYVGMQRLLGSTLGEGGPAAPGFSLTGSGQPSQWAGAVQNAETASNTTMPRGGGPISANFSGSSQLGDASADYDLSIGIFAGSLWFDSDTNNDGQVDSFATLNGSWHFDHTTAVASGKNDFYSVALHEILHAIGFGASDTWDSLVDADGTTWLGDEAKKLNLGTGVDLVTPDGHISSGFMSTRLSDGAAQESVMDPDLTVGTRKFLTQMDMAFLRDIGYEAIPEPSSVMLVLGGVAVFFRRRKKSNTA